MYKQKWLRLASILVVVGWLLAGCGEESAEEAPGQLPASRLNLAECSKAAASITARAGVPSPTPNPTAGVRVELAPGTQLFLSNTFPYALALPDNWEVKDGQVQGNIKGDLFIIRKSNTSGAYVTVIAEKLNGPEDSKVFYDTKLKEARTVTKVEYEEQGQRTVGSVPAYVLAFNTPAGQSFAYPVQSIQVLFAAQGRGWGVTFTASPNQAGQACAQFARLLDSWTFTGLVK